MPGRRLLALSAVTLAVGAVAWALIGLPGAPAACLPADCDCEAAGPGPNRQPANAWSSLALAAAGIATLIASPAGLSGSPPRPRLPQAAAEGARSNRARPGEALLPLASAEGTTSRARHRALTRTIVGGALVAAGSAAFLYHAALTAWAARLDGITVAILVGALVLHGFYRLPRGGGGGAAEGHGGGQEQQHPAGGGAAEGHGGGQEQQHPAGGGAAEGRGGGQEQQHPGGGGAAEGRGGGSREAQRKASPSGSRRGGNQRNPSPQAATWARAGRALAPWLLVAVGGLCWRLGQSDGPWCRPDSLLQAHAAWHLLAAGAIGLWLSREKSGRTVPQVLLPSSLRAGEPDIQ